MKENEVKTVYNSLLSCNVQVCTQHQMWTLEMWNLRIMNVKNIVFLEVMACVLVKVCRR